jgi:hypothetical protein
MGDLSSTLAEAETQLVGGKHHLVKLTQLMYTLCRQRNGGLQRNENTNCETGKMETNNIDSPNQGRCGGPGKTSAETESDSFRAGAPDARRSGQSKLGTMACKIATNRHGNLLFRLYWNGLESWEGTRWKDTAENRELANATAKLINKEIKDGSFDYLSWFPRGTRQSSFEKKDGGRLGTRF